MTGLNTTHFRHVGAIKVSQQIWLKGKWATRTVLCLTNDNAMQKTWQITATTIISDSHTKINKKAKKKGKKGKT